MFRRIMLLGAVTCFVVSGALVAVAAPKESPPSIAVDGQKQLFIDGRFIDKPQGIELRLHQPTKAEMVLQAVDPDEQRRGVLREGHRTLPSEGRGVPRRGECRQCQHPGLSPSRLQLSVS